ncbi:MAG: proton-conducting transporter membrane subunit [Terriglobales bacterium]
MTAWLFALLFCPPAVAVVISLAVRRARIAEFANLAAAILSLAAAVGLVALAGDRPSDWLHQYLILDRLDAWVILCVAVVYCLASIYGIGYMRLLGDEKRLPGYYALFAGFALTMFLACAVNNVGLYWIAIELTTVVSTFLVGYEPAAESTEAAWKYIILVSAGITLALLGTVLFYWGGTFVLGPRYQPTWAALAAAAPRVDPRLLALAFLLVLVGYGTKAGLAPMHTWLPDAHSEAPAPVSAMLSGALLNVALLGIVRFLGIVEHSEVARLAQGVLVIIGVFSFLIAALFITRQRGIKRLMAYSSIEHIGVIALGFGFGGVLGVAGALYQMLNHSLNKSLMFFGAGNSMRAFGTKEIGHIGGVLKVFPITGAIWIAGAIAITGAPPFGLFLSEFTVLRSGIRDGQSWAVWIIAVLLIVVFVAFLAHFRRMFFSQPAKPTAPGTLRIRWQGSAMVLAFCPLLILGLWWPHALWVNFSHIAHALGGWK